MEKSLVNVKNLSKYFKINRFQTLKAVDHVTFNISRGETLGIVGESGCGKSTLGKTIMGLYKATTGDVIFDDLNVHKASRRELKVFKKKAQIIFQDPYSSLNPRMTVGDIISEGIVAHKLYNNKERKEKVFSLLNLVGLNQEHASRFPHEFSGGQRQRIGIARALALKPEFIVCDEPISALDVSIQAQIVNLLIDLQENFKLTYLFIAHDLSMVSYISNRIAVMYVGNIVEIGNNKDLYANPLHPYTQGLLSAIPSTDLNNPISKRRIKISGNVQSPINPKPGCKFVGRCRYAQKICKNETPLLREVEDNHFVACHLI